MRSTHCFAVTEYSIKGSNIFQRKIAVIVAMFVLDVVALIVVGGVAESLGKMSATLLVLVTTKQARPTSRGEEDQLTVSEMVDSVLAGAVVLEGKFLLWLFYFLFPERYINHTNNSLSRLFFIGFRHVVLKFVIIC